MEASVPGCMVSLFDRSWRDWRGRQRSVLPLVAVHSCVCGVSGVCGVCGVCGVGMVQ